MASTDFDRRTRELIRAIQQGEGSEWRVADLLLTYSNLEWNTVVAKVKKYIGWSANRCTMYLATAKAWPEEARLRGCSFEYHKRARKDPGFLVAKWDPNNPSAYPARPDDRKREQKRRNEHDTVSLMIALVTGPNMSDARFRERVEEIMETWVPRAVAA